MSVIPGASGDRSNERADVARRILELSGTIAEAVDYMIDKLESMEEDAGGFAGMLKDIGEGLISLDSASSAIVGAMGADAAGTMALAMEYDALTERLDVMADAYLEGRASDLPALGRLLKESFTAYSGGLSQCFRGASIM